jgi:hypothetical protein
MSRAHSPIQAIHAWLRYHTIVKCGMNHNLPAKQDSLSLHADDSEVQN